MTRDYPASLSGPASYRPGVIIMLRNGVQHARRTVIDMPAEWCSTWSGKRSCSPVDVFTQGKTLDEAVKNAQEAVALHLEDEANRQALAKYPSLFIVMEAPLKRVA